MSENIYYVYQLIDPRNDLPFYVGKGKHKRMYQHVEQARRPSGIRCNKQLQNKIRKILSLNIDIRYNKIAENLCEDEAYVLEKQIITEIGIGNLCNLTTGGRQNHWKGTSFEKAVLEKIRIKLAEWRVSDSGKEHFKKMSELRKGSGNPMYGKKESVEHKASRMKNMLDAPRWNVGLTIEQDERLKKLGDPHRGKIPHNAIETRFKNMDSGVIVGGRTIKEASKIAGFSLATGNRLKAGTIKQHKGWIYLHE